MILLIVLLLVGFAILRKDADFLVNSASFTAKKYGISNLVINLIVVACGAPILTLVNTK